MHFRNVLSAKFNPSRFEVCVIDIPSSNWCSPSKSKLKGRGVCPIIGKISPVSVFFCSLLTSKLCNFKEGSVIYDWASCPGVEHEVNFESTIFLTASGGKLERIHLKAWFEVTLFVWSRRLQKFRGKKPDVLFTTSCHWSSINWTEMGLGELLFGVEF